MKQKPLTSRWPSVKVIEEARKRTRATSINNASDTQSSTIAVRGALEKLLIEAGWSEDDFIDALCEDVGKKGLKHTIGPKLAHHIIHHN